MSINALAAAGRSVPRYDTPKPAAPTADQNPKHAAGRSKPSFRHIPPVALVEVGKVFDHGAAKYGAHNFTETGVVASVYYDAAMRHLVAWFAGEDIDPESGLHHMAHVMAGSAIILACEAKGNMKDDRPESTPAPFEVVLPALPGVLGGMAFAGTGSSRDQ